MIHLDTSALVDALVSPHRSFDRLMSLVEDGHRLGMSTVVLYEWLRGPRTVAERLAQELTTLMAEPAQLAQQAAAAANFARPDAAHALADLIEGLINGSLPGHPVPEHAGGAA